MKNKITSLLLFLFLISCKENNKYREQNTYQIITHLVNKYKKRVNPHIAFPPPPDGNKYTFTYKDSLRIYKYYYEQSSKKKVIAISDRLTADKDDYKINVNCNKEWSRDLLTKFKLLNGEEKLDISKITIYDNDTLITYKREFKKLPWKGFDLMDAVFSFSKISFNKEYDKAIVIVGFQKGHLNGFSRLVFLKKINYHWKVVSEQTLTIS